jgi:hypothetical protein
VEKRLYQRTQRMGWIIHEALERTILGNECNSHDSNETIDRSFGK